MAISKEREQSKKEQAAIAAAKAKASAANKPQASPVDQQLQQTMQYFMGPGQQAGADISAQVSQDILGPGYQAATYGTAAGGLPGAVGRVRAGQDATNRKAAIESARMRRENTLASAQVGMEAIKQMTARQQLSFEQGQTLSQLYGDNLAFLESANLMDDYGPALPGALNAATEVLRQTGDALLAQQAFMEALGLGSTVTSTTDQFGPGYSKQTGATEEGIYGGSAEATGLTSSERKET
tara:strand:- start:1686 stop:2402 length:717 start_codon:yes stop_codon:yes gene_type:complete